MHARARLDRSSRFSARPCSDPVCRHMHTAGALIGRPLASLLLAVVLSLSASAARALPLQIVTAALGGGTAGVAYADSVQSASGTAPIAWTLDSGSLPTG